MSFDRMTLARARLALGEAVRGWLFDPNVSLIGLGLPEREGRPQEDELAIRIHVRQKLSGFALEAASEAGDTRPIPPSIGGFPTDVPEGRYQPHRWPWPGSWRPWRPTTNARASRASPMQGGISISNERQHNYGTLGALVVDRNTGKLMCLSNWHVLVGDWGMRLGQRIYQPGRSDGGTRADTIATLTRHAMGANLDAAVATLTGDRELINDQLDLGPVRGVGQLEPGMEVAKSGRKTQVTYGRIHDIEALIPMPYAGLTRIIRGVMTIEQRRPGEQVSAGGDSGSLWLERATMKAVGLHFAGSDQPERALAIDIRLVLAALDVDLFTKA
jgi:endonuclease G